MITIHLGSYQHWLCTQEGIPFKSLANPRKAVSWEKLVKARCCLSDSGCWQWTWDWHEEPKHVHQKAKQAGLIYTSLLKTNKHNFLQKETPLRQKGFSSHLLYYMFPLCLLQSHATVLKSPFITLILSTQDAPNPFLCPFPYAPSCNASLCVCFKSFTRSVSSCPPPPQMW